MTTTALPIIARLALPLTERACDALCNDLATALNDDDLTERDCYIIIALADMHSDDHAAHIIDTIRDNNFLDLDI